MNFGDMTWTMTMAKCPCCKSHLAYSSDNNYNTWKCYSCGFTMFKQRSEQMMTREEAIEIFKRLKENAPNEMHLETVGTAQELFDMAIQALSQEPCDDAVSRQAVINAIENDCMKGGLGSCFACYNDAQAFRGEIEKLPPVTHKSKTGRWVEETKRECVFSIKDEDYECREYGNVIYLHCSNCGWKTGSQANDFNYCPNCGAKMVEPQESEDKE